MRKYFLLNTLLFILLAITNLFAEESFEKPKVRSEEPIEINSEKIDIYRNKGEIIFINNVRAKQGEMILLSDNMTIFYNEQKEKDIIRPEIKEIFAQDNVQFFSNKIHASGKTGNYNLSNSLITIRGNVEMNEKGSTVFGEKMTYNVNTEETKITGNRRTKDGRVIILIEDTKGTEQRIKETKHE